MKENDTIMNEKEIQVNSRRDFVKKRHQDLAELIFMRKSNRTCFNRQEVN